jgi:hypothetical protein
MELKNNMKKLLITPENPEGILVDLTVEDIAQRQIDAQKAEQDRIAHEQKQAQELANKQSALTKLSALGLTEAEIKSIIG